MGALLLLLALAAPLWAASAPRTAPAGRPAGPAALAPFLPSLAAPSPSPALSVPGLGAASVAPAPAPLTAPPLDLSPAAGVYERKGVGLLVVDLRDSTALHQDLGNRRAHALASAVLGFAEASARDFDGAVVRRMGDGYLMVFPELERAMRAAAAIQENLPAWRERAGAPAVELRAAVHAGRVLVDAAGKVPEVYGQTVERAIALADRSLGGEVAMDPAVAEHLLARGWAGRAEPGRDGGVALLRLRPAAAPRLPETSPAPVPVTAARAATLFTDLEGWPQAFERYGRRRAYTALKTFHAHAAAVVERHGGHVVKTSGESLMASFPDSVSAVRAGLELQARMPEVRRASPLGRVMGARVGISAGNTLRENGDGWRDYFGNAVNVAARLMKRAAPGEVLVGQYAWAQEPAVEALLERSPREELDLKGIRLPATVVRAAPVPMAPDPEAVSRLRAVAHEAFSRVPRRADSLNR